MNYCKPQKRAAFAQLLVVVQQLSDAELNNYVGYDRVQRGLIAIAECHGLAGNDVRDVVNRARMVERGRRKKLRRCTLESDERDDHCRP